MGKILAGVTLLVFSLGIAGADEFIAQISKVDGKKITAKVVKFDKDNFKGGKGGKGGFGKDMFKDAEEKRFMVTSDCKFVKKGKFDKETKKAETTVLEDGLKDKLFTEITEEKPLRANITTNDKGEITEISVGGARGNFGGKKKKDATSY